MDLRVRGDAGVWQFQRSKKEREKANGSKVRGMKDTNQTPVSNEKNTTKAVGEQEVGEVISVWAEVVKLLERHRHEFKQERTFRRMVVMIIGVIISLGRHTMSQMITSVGYNQQDWSSWYRMLRGERFKEEDLSQRLMEQTLEHVKEDEQYVIATDATHIGRSSKTMAGTSWVRGFVTAVFDRGLQRAQRFVTCVWMPKIEEGGYSRAIPIRMLSAFSKTAAKSSEAVRTEYEAGLAFAQWTRQLMDGAKRTKQQVLWIADGAYDKVEVWRNLPDRLILLVRTAKNRVLYELPGAYIGKGRRNVKYGKRAPTPNDHLNDRSGWANDTIQVRGRKINIRWKRVGPFLRQGVSELPVYLLVCGGASWTSGKGKHRNHYRKPAFYLMNALKMGDTWTPAISERAMLAWVWQRWEIEVTHREMKTGFGVGEMQCWNPVSAVLSVQWMVWVMGVLMLAAYRAWGIVRVKPAPVSAWHLKVKRWSFNTLWRSLRRDLARIPDFNPILRPTCVKSTQSPQNFAFLAQAALNCVRG